MLSKTRGIVLHAIPYNDTYSIIYMYTEAFGRVSYLVSRSRGRRGAVSKALFMPLAVLEMEVDHQAKRELHRVKEARLCFPMNDLLFNPVKNAIALFLGEVLFRAVKEREPDAHLFRYLYESIHLLEYADAGIANFHLVFLLGLLRFMGIFPNVEAHREDSYFDLLNGEFVSRIPMHRHYLDPEETRIFACLLRISYENMSLYVFSRQDRIRIIRRIFEYYRLHLPEFPEIKSLEVMQGLFD